MNRSVDSDALRHAMPLDDDRENILLKRMWQAVWSRKWAVLLFALLAVAATWYFVSRMTPQYTATVSVMLDNRNVPLISFDQGSGGATPGREYLSTQIALMQSRQVAERVVQDLALTEHPEFDPTQQQRPLIDPKGWLREASMALGLTERPDAQPAPSAEQRLQRATKALMSRVDVEPQGKSQLVALSVQMADRVMAARVANSLAENYLEAQLDAKVDASLSAAGWMNDRLVELREQLQTSEARLQAYLDEEGLVDLNGVTTITAGELSGTSDRMLDASRARAEAESQYRQVENMRTQGWERMASVPAVLSNPLVQRFKTEVAGARARVEDLSSRYGPKHPAMRSAQSDLNAATTSLRGQVEQVVASIERNYQLAVANESAIRASFDNNKERIQDIGRKNFRVQELQRDVDSNRTLYDTFLNRMRETTATSDLAAVNARIVDRALPPTTPSAPKLSLFLAAALALALLIGVGMAILLELLNDTFKSTDDVEAKLNLPVLGIVPSMPKRAAQQMLKLFDSGSDRRFSESIRTLRTNITLGDGKRDQQTLLVTSTAPGEGKSAVAVNLAFAMSQLERVLLIDADLRRPCLARNFDFAAGTPGLANLIAGTAKADECIHRVGSLDMMPAGTVPPNPLELLASPRFMKVLEMARSHYDRIIIDSPPSQAVSDAAVLSSSADAVVYVIKSESTPIAAAHGAIGQMLQRGATILGVVLNQVDRRKLRRNRGYSGYYDHYGYSDLPENPSNPSVAGDGTRIAAT